MKSCLVWVNAASFQLDEIELAMRELPQFLPGQNHSPGWRRDMKDLHKLTVLLVEDSRIVANFLGMILQEYPYISFTVHATATLSEGLRLASTEPVDVVILDLNLEDSTGNATVAAFQEAHPEVPIVVLTGMDTDAESCILAGAQEHLTKGSVQLDGLLRAIRRAVVRHEVRGVYAKIGKTMTELQATTQALCDLVRTGEQ